MVSAEFAKHASAIPLHNHGRRWDVFFNGKSLGFADSITKDEAIKEAHKREVNNALYSLTDDKPDFMERQQMPPTAVLAEYQDLVKKFAEVFHTVDV